jgi:CheY-like chemotaxis protein
MNERKILIVDDDILLILGLKRRLRAAGYTAIYAVDAATALSTAQKESPELIITDLGMAGCDGFMLIDHLKATPSTARIPIVVLTGHGGPANRQRALEAGAVDFLEKPASEDQILRSIQSALR